MNLHNHSTWSDGQCSVLQLAEAALEYGITELAVTDHLAIPKTRSLGIHQLHDYQAQIREIARGFAGRNLNLLVGIEIDGKTLRNGWDSLPVDTLNTFDLILFEYVTEDRNQGLDLNSFLLLRKQFIMPVGLAHNDLEWNFPNWEVLALSSLLAREQVFVELNSVYNRPFTVKPYYQGSEAFFRCSGKTRLQLSIGSDTHQSPKEVGNVRNPYEFLASLGLLAQLIHFR